MRCVWLLALLSTQAFAQAGSFQCYRRVGTTLGIEYWYEAGKADAGTAQDRVPEFMQRGFTEPWAAFINTRFNAQPGLTAEDDIMVAAVRFVLANNRPWREVFIGRFGVKGPYGFPVVIDAPEAPPHGFFGLGAWQTRYQGNASDGAMLQASYRILKATLGFELVPSPKNATGDASHTGRQRDECRGCHFDSPYALDKVAAILPWHREGVASKAKVVPQVPVPQVLFGGRTVSSLDELLRIAVESDAFLFWSCQLAFEFAVGRHEFACEAPIFDRCVDTLRATQDIRQAVASIMQDPSYCAELWP